MDFERVLKRAHTLIELPPWLVSIASDLRSRVAEGKSPHAILVSGTEGLGKARLAGWFARVLLCAETSFEARPCGDCAECRLSAESFHPDLIEITTGMPDEKGKATSEAVIVVGTIRKLINKLSLTSNRGRGQVVVVDPADRLHRSSSNALLKTLEEPSDSVTIVLLSSQPLNISATIASRCQKIRISSPQRDEAMEWLSDRSDASTSALQTALELAEGAPLAALRLVEQGAVETYATMHETLTALFKGHHNPVSAAASWDSNGQSLLLLGDWLSRRLRKAANEGDRKKLQVLLSFQAPLNQAIRLMESTASADLVMEQLLAKWTELIELPSKNTQTSAVSHLGGWT